MKNMKIKLRIFLCANILLTSHFLASEQPITPEPTAQTTMWERAKSWLYTTRLFPGYHSTPQEKEAAQQKIQELLLEREQIKEQLTDTKLTQEERTHLNKKIAELDQQIKEQKIITGEQWTKLRHAFWWGTGTLGFILLSRAALFSKIGENISYKIVKIQLPRVVDDNKIFTLAVLDFEYIKGFIADMNGNVIRLKDPNQFPILDPAKYILWQYMPNKNDWYYSHLSIIRLRKRDKLSIAPERLDELKKEAIKENLK